MAALGELSDQNKRTKWSGPSYADTLMEPLRELGLVDLAVRSGIGTLLRCYLQNCQVSCWVACCAGMPRCERSANCRATPLRKPAK